MANVATWEFTLSTPDETEACAAALAPHLKPGDVIVLVGDLGAGKTRFTQGLGAALGVNEDVTSPTFNILLEYRDGRLPLYHFDLYRLEDETQLEDIDYFAMVEGDGVSVIEWGDKFPEALPEDRLEIDFEVGADEVRVARVSPQGPRAASLLRIWRSSVEDAAVSTDTSRERLMTQDGSAGSEGAAS